MNVLIEALIWIVYLLSLYFSVFLFLVYVDKKNLFKEKLITKIPKEPFVSILVPAYNEENTILRTLQSIQDLDYPKEKTEVIVINDGSSDNTELIVANYIQDKPHFKLISHTNRGKAASMNVALDQANGEFFACLDADSFVESSTLKKMLALYYKENNPSLAIITPAMKVHSPKNILQRIQWLEYIVIILIARITSYLDSLYVAPGPFSIYKTSIIKKIGGFDENNITEDQEIAYRAQQHNYQIKQCVDGYVYTTAPHKLKPFYHQRRRWYLGSLSCLHKYKNLIANRNYGDFGIMQMIKNALGYLLAISGIFLAFYLMIIPLFKSVKNLALVKFNIIPYLTNFTIKLSMLDLLLADFRRVFIFIFLFLLGMFFFVLAHRNANERIMKFGWIPLIPYFVFYYMLKGSILLLSLLHFSRKRKLKW